MIIESIREYYESLKQKLQRLQDALEAVVNRMKDTASLIEGCTTAKTNIENYVSDTLETASQKCKKSATANFEAYYMKNLNSILGGQSIASALDSIASIKSDASKKYLDDEEESKRIEGDIKNTNDEMNTVSLQMQNEEVEVN